LLLLCHGHPFDMVYLFVRRGENFFNTVSAPVSILYLWGSRRQLEVFQYTYILYILRKNWHMISCHCVCLSNSMHIFSDNIWTDLQMLLKHDNEHYATTLLYNLLHESCWLVKWEWH
jgi:hypothetical protein